MHPQTARYLELLAAWVPRVDHVPTLAEMRVDRRETHQGERLRLPLIEDRTVRGVPVRVYRPVAGSEPLPALVYFHGGGWVIGSIDDVDATCRRLSAGAGCVVVNVGYRLAPEHPFPAAVEDAWTVIADLAARPDRYGIESRAIAVAGDSAGGTLATVTALRARDTGLALAHQVLLCPATDAAMDTESFTAYAAGYALDGRGMARFYDMYLGGADRTDPRISPLRAPDVSGMAPATIITAEYDVLRDEAEAYAAMLEAAGVPVELTRCEGMVHSFFILPELFDTALAARRHVLARLRAAFADALTPAR